MQTSGGWNQAGTFKELKKVSVVRVNKQRGIKTESEGADRDQVVQKAVRPSKEKNLDFILMC